MLGSVEAGAFTGDQLRMIGEFVERRGGGLLVLGGRAIVRRRRLCRHAGRGRPAGHARAAGAIGDPLPVARLHVEPTRAGEAHGVTQIARDRAASLARWKDMPVLTSVNPIRAVKPGATVLLSGSDGRQEQVVLA